MVDGHGTIYVSDYGNQCIRKVVPADWTVSTLCGKKGAGFADGAAAAARLHYPRKLALDMDNNLIVADTGNHSIRKITNSHVSLSTVAGSRAGGKAGQGFADGEAAAARFNNPLAVAVDGFNTILVTDFSNYRLRRIASENAQVTTLAGSSEAGKVDGEGASARFKAPWAMALDERGRLLVVDHETEGCLRVAEATHAPRLRLAVETIQNHTHVALEDYAKLLTDTSLADVTFAVDGQRFRAYRGVLAARSPYFKALFAAGKVMREEGSRASGGEIVLEEMSATEFEKLLEYLYGHKLPEGEEWQAGPGPGEMAVVEDRFQACGLYAHCVGKFRRGLKAGNVTVRLVQARDSGLAELEEVAMGYLKANVLAFQVFFVCVNICCESLSTRVLSPFGTHTLSLPLLLFIFPPRIAHAFS